MGFSGREPIFFLSHMQYPSIPANFDLVSLLTKMSNFLIMILFGLINF